MTEEADGRQPGSDNKGGKKHVARVRPSRHPDRARRRSPGHRGGRAQGDLRRGRGRRHRDRGRPVAVPHAPHRVDGTTPMSAIVVEDLAKRYGGFTAVEDVSFTAATGEVT